MKPRFKNGSSSPDDIRDDGWFVAVHNDYTLRNEKHTFWLFTKPIHGVTIAVKGEGSSDQEALDLVRIEIRSLDSKLAELAKSIIEKSMRTE